MIRTDDLFINGLKIYQDTERFCFGTDSLLLAKFAFVKKTLAMCDLCTGTAVLPLLASAETLCEKIYGVEISPEIAALANRSVCFNGLGDKINIIEGDVRDIRNLLPSSKFDLVTVNPPYMPRGGGFLSCGKKTAARAETECSLADVCAAAAYLLKNRGRLCVVSRADRLSDLFDAFFDSIHLSNNFSNVMPGFFEFCMSCSFMLSRYSGVSPAFRTSSGRASFISMSNRD